MLKSSKKKRKLGENKEDLAQWEAKWWDWLEDEERDYWKCHGKLASCFR